MKPADVRRTIAVGPDRINSAGRIGLNPPQDSFHQGSPGTRPTSALTAVELLIALAALVILVALVLLARSNAERNKTCGPGIGPTGIAFRTWALDNGIETPRQLLITNGRISGPLKAGQVYFGWLADEPADQGGSEPFAQVLDGINVVSNRPSAP